MNLKENFHGPTNSYGVNIYVHKECNSLIFHITKSLYCCWYLGTTSIRELDKRIPEDVSEEEINLLILKYSMI